MPRYQQRVLVAPGDVRRIRAAAGFTVTRFALELGVDRRTVQRWEVAGAVLERVPSLLMEYPTSRLGRLANAAECGRLELELVDALRDRDRLVVKLRARRQPRHFSSIAKKRPRKNAKATRSGRGPVRRHG